MKILSVNAGSSSLKFQAYEMPEEKVLISGVFERIGLDNSFYTIKLNSEKIRHEVELPNHKEAFEILVEELKSNNIVDSLDEIKGIGHRIVQGGSYFDKTVVATEEVIAKIDELSSLAPLHNPAAIVGIRAAEAVVPNAIQTVVFDTAFHQTIEKDKYLYAVPYEWYQKYGVRKYGFHGTSHKYIRDTMQKILNKEDVNIISCHIGSGASITAIKNGKSYDTTMGLTPLDGLIMCTRSGSVDPSILNYVSNQTGKSLENITDELNQNSGLLGICGFSDWRDVENSAKNGNEMNILSN